LIRVHASSVDFWWINGLRVSEELSDPAPAEAMAAQGSGK